MKKTTSVLTAAALVAMGATVAFAGWAPGTGVQGSAHDITYMSTVTGSNYTADDFQRVCVFCHTPHNAQPNGSVPAPLWNHAKTSNVALNPYAWAAPANTTIAIEDPLVGPSRLCMGCHDGVTAVDSHGAAGQGGNASHGMDQEPTASYDDPINGNGGKAYRYFEGVNGITNTHPIGFLYQDAISKRNLSGRPAEIVPASAFFLSAAPANTHTRTVTSSDGTTHIGDSSLKMISETLYNGYFTCASCHDVHNTNNASNHSNSGAAPNYFLWATETNSVICLSCHIK